MDAKIDPPAGAISHLILVDFETARFTLTVLHPSVAIRPGDSVLWRFSGLPEGWSPWIEFRDADSIFLGPFESLSQGAGEIWGTCRAALVPGPIHYRAFAQRGMGGSQDGALSLAASKTVELSVHAQDEGSTKTFVVDFDATGEKLVVIPESLVYDTLDVIEWEFRNIPGLPGEYRPRVDFFEYDGNTPSPNPLLGPFTSLTYHADRVAGMGNGGFQGRYHFEVSLVRIATGEVVWVGSGDPVIDNRGSTGP